MGNRNGSRVSLVAYANQSFGTSVVIDPEVRVPRPDRPGSVYRCARLRCKCGNIYLAPLSPLYAGKRQSCADCVSRGRPRSKGARVTKNKTGYSVNLYGGWFKSRAEAEDVARRARLVILPKVPPRTLLAVSLVMSGFSGRDMEQFKDCVRDVLAMAELAMKFYGGEEDGAAAVDDFKMLSENVDVEGCLRVAVPMLGLAWKSLAGVRAQAHGTTQRQELDKMLSVFRTSVL